MDRLCIQNSQIFRIDELQSSFIQIQEQVFALKQNYRRYVMIKSCFRRRNVCSNCRVRNSHHPIARRHRASRSCQTTSRGCIYLQLLMNVLVWGLPRRFPPSQAIVLQIWWAYPSLISRGSCDVCGWIKHGKSQIIFHWEWEIEMELLSKLTNRLNSGKVSSER